MNGRLVSSVPKKPRSRVNAARVRTPPRAALSAMVHLEETEPAPERASEDACASGDASDAGYAQRIDKEWRDQLASARDANAGLDENDVDARELYGEQAVHNFPDVHEDWGDAKARAARAARMRAVAEMSPDGKEGLERTGWNTAYRAGLESALDAVRDSKTMMANLRQIRSRQKDIDDGVEIGHLKGKTAKEANAEWEKQRLEARDAERRRRAAAATLAAKHKGGRGVVERRWRAIRLAFSARLPEAVLPGRRRRRGRGGGRARARGEARRVDPHARRGKPDGEGRDARHS